MILFKYFKYILSKKSFHQELTCPNMNEIFEIAPSKKIKNFKLCFLFKKGIF